MNTEIYNRWKTVGVLLLAVFVLPSSSVRAQEVKGVIADSLLGSYVTVSYNPVPGGDRFRGYKHRVKLDAESRFSFIAGRLGDEPDLSAANPFFPAYLTLGDGTEVGILLQRAHPVEMRAAKVKGNTIVKFSGVDSDASVLFYQYVKAYDYELFFPYEDEGVKMGEQEAISELEKRYTRLKGEARKIKDPTLRQFLMRLNEDAHTNFLLRLLPKADERRKSMTEHIDVNSWVGLYNYLPQTRMSSMMPKDMDSLIGHDMTDYGLKYMTLIREQVKDSIVRCALLKRCAEMVLRYGKDYADIDRFWIPFRQYAGERSSVVKDNESKVAAIKATKVGNKAPDFEYTDRDGKLHRLSDYRGKLVYIDFWATWCGPCCAEIPHLEKRVEEMKGDDRIVFISISMDRNREAWLEKLAKDAPQWPQFIVTDVQNEKVSKAYGITGIPRFLVIKPDGTIGSPDAFRPSDADFAKKLTGFMK